MHRWDPISRSEGHFSEPLTSKVPSRSFLSTAFFFKIAAIYFFCWNGKIYRHTIGRIIILSKKFRAWIHNEFVIIIINQLSFALFVANITPDGGENKEIRYPLRMKAAPHIHDSALFFLFILFEILSQWSLATKFLIPLECMKKKLAKLASREVRSLKSYEEWNYQNPSIEWKYVRYELTFLSARNYLHELFFIVQKYQKHSQSNLPLTEDLKSLSKTCLKRQKKSTPGF